MSDTGSGLDSQFGIKDEGGTVGSGGTPDRFYPHEGAGLTLTPTYSKSDAIKAGETVRSIDNMAIVKKTAGGPVTVPVTYKDMGLLWKYLIGSDGVAVSDGTLAYKQIHTPGGMRSKSFAAQVGKPDPATGVVEPRNYNGCKITDWTLTIAEGEFVKLQMTVDAWDESDTPALAVATYTADNPIWSFSEATVFKIGGTPSTAAGETTVTGGTAVSSIITSLAFKGKNNLAVERFGVGNAGVKGEQLQNGFLDLTGTFEGEFNPSQFGTPFRAGTTVAFEVGLVSATEIETGKPFGLSIIVPAAKITECPEEVSGADIVTVKGTFEVGKLAGNPAIQVKIRSDEATI